jgi:hypothetical protein
MNVEKAIDQFFHNYENLKVVYGLKIKDLSDVDKELTAFYHKLEGVHLSHNTQAHKFMVKLQDILSRRRQIKLDIILVKTFIDNTSNSMSEAEKRNKKALGRHLRVLDEMG